MQIIQTELNRTPLRADFSRDGHGIFVDGAAEIYVRNNTIDDSNADAQNDVGWGSLTMLDSIMMLDMNHGTVCGTALTGTSGPIGVDQSARSVTVSPACP